MHEAWLVANVSRTVNWLRAFDRPLISMAVVGGAFVVVALAIYFGQAVTVLGLLALIVFPAQTVFALLLGIEEEVVAGGHSVEAVSPLVRVGSEFFLATAGGLRLPLAVILLGTGFVLLRHRKGFPTIPMFLVSCLVIWAICLALVQGFELSAAFGVASPWLLVLCGFVFGTFVSVSLSLRSQIVWIAAALLFVKAVVGAVVFARGEAIPDPTGLASVVYYDSTLSYVAMTFLVAWMFTTVRHRPATLLMVSSVVVLLVAMRRNVIAATGWAIMVVSLFRGMWQQTLKVGGTLLLVVVGASLFLSGPLGKIGAGIERSISTLLTGDGDSSTTGHVNDIEVGFGILLQSPIWGLGVYPGPQAGLVVGNSGNLYIHNELLQTWARFGLGGVLLVIGILALGVYYARRVAVEGTTDVLGMAAAAFFLACPIPLMFFPHLSTLTRFGFFAGLFLAIVSHDAAARFRLNVEDKPSENLTKSSLPDTSRRAT